MKRFSGYNKHAMMEPRYGAVVGYSSSSESYAAKTEQVVEYGGLARKPYKDVADIHHQLLQPAAAAAAWSSSPPDRHKKSDKSSSPRVRPASAWNNVHLDNSPTSKNHSGKYNNSNYSSDEESDDDEYGHNDNVVCDKYGNCYPKPKHAQDHYDDHYASPPNGYPNPNNHKSKPNGNRYTSPPNPQPYYEDAPKPNGINYYTTPPPSQPYANGYTTPPPQSYYETPNYPNGANDYTTPHSPPQQPYYEANNKPMMHKPLPSVKTRLADHHSNKGSMDSKLENMRIGSPKAKVGSPKSPYSPRSPFGSSSLQNDHRQTIDSEEARRRYGGATVDAPVEQYKGTIGSQEAAKKYRGVFVKY